MAVISHCVRVVPSGMFFEEISLPISDPDPELEHALV